VGVGGRERDRERYRDRDRESKGDDCKIINRRKMIGK
jgi:hypothetical protein